MVVVALLGGVPGSPVRRAEAAFVLFDDFGGILLDGTKWGSFVDDYALEKIHMIDALVFPTSNPQLIVARRFRAGPSFGQGGPFSNRYWLSAHPDTRGIAADVTLSICLAPVGTIHADLRLETSNNKLELGITCALNGGVPAATVTWSVTRCFVLSPCQVQATGDLGTAGFAQRTRLTIAWSPTTVHFGRGDSGVDVPLTADGASAGFATLEVRVDGDSSTSLEYAVLAGFDEVWLDLP